MGRGRGPLSLILLAKHEEAHFPGPEIEPKKWARFRAHVTMKNEGTPGRKFSPPQE